MKFCTLNPLIWNTENYTKVSRFGLEAEKNFRHDSGYGYEEWNNSPDLFLNGQRYFQSRFEKLIIAKANNRELVIIMIVSYDRSQYGVGIEAGVGSIALCP